MGKLWLGIFVFKSKNTNSDHVKIMWRKWRPLMVKHNNNTRRWMNTLNIFSFPRPLSLSRTPRCCVSSFASTISRCFNNCFPFPMRSFASMEEGKNIVPFVWSMPTAQHQPSVELPKRSITLNERRLCEPCFLWKTRHAGGSSLLIHPALTWLSLLIT